MIENLIPNFHIIYQNYTELFDRTEDKILDEDNESNIIDLMSFRRDFGKFDTKLRLVISITNIELDDNFVRRKIGDLKDCHLYFYKLSDIWFAYEAFFHFYKSALNINLSSRKIVWLDDATNSIYLNNNDIVDTLHIANQNLGENFNNNNKRVKLKEYLIYSRDYATGGQLNRLNIVIDKIDTQNINPMNHTDFLTIAYSIRNNFVHNGEVTIYPENFSYVLKSKLLKILYKYLVVITVKSATITIENRLNIV
ncbi:MAG TPA: hypothetical protein DEQ26_11840 [Flavobacteriaceae bacterium]|nr:hypothetical protein [Flavobacteriaceae bacterium]